MEGAVQMSECDNEERRVYRQGEEEDAFKVSENLSYLPLTAAC